MKFIFFYLLYVIYGYSINKVRRYRNSKMPIEPRFTQISKIPNFHNVDQDDPPYISPKYITTNYVKPIYAEFENFLEKKEKVRNFLFIIRL